MAIESYSLFVIIVTYKGKQWYDRCFESLRHSTLPVTTIVVDNASNDGSADYIKNNYPEIVLIESDTNLGFGQANNKAMRYALDHGCDYVFLLNQDAWVEPDTFERLVSIHKKHRNFGIVSPMHLNADKQSFENGFLHYVSDHRIIGLDFVDDLYFGRLKDIYSIQYVNAAAWLLPRKTIETIGGFDPLFFHYGEDDNYMSRVLYHGFKIGICPGVHIVHDAKNPGVRKKGREEEIRRHKVILLMEYADVMNKKKISKGIITIIKRIVKAVLQFKFSYARQLIEDALFLAKNNNRIIRSLQCNKIQGANWL